MAFSGVPLCDPQVEWLTHRGEHYRWVLPASGERISLLADPFLIIAAVADVSAATLPWMRKALHRLSASGIPVVALCETGGLGKALPSAAQLVSSRATPEELARAVSAVRPSVMETMVANFAFRWNLSPREARVLRSVSDGIHGKALASELGCSCSTVDVYWGRILRKCGVATREGVVALLFRFIVEKGVRSAVSFHAPIFPSDDRKGIDRQIGS